MSEGFGAKVPADVERPDRVLAGLTARQVAILAATAATVYGQWWVIGRVVPLIVFAVLAGPLVVAGIALAVGRRDGVAVFDLARAALAFRMRARRLHTRPPGTGPAAPGWARERAHYSRYPCGRTGQLRLPPHAITDTPHHPAPLACLDLGTSGVAVIAAASTVNFSMRTDTEQYALIGCFARLLHAQTGPVQILIRTHQIDLRPALAELADSLGRLPHPTLRAAATAHHRWLSELATDTTLLTHQVLLVLREPTHLHTTQPGFTGAVGSGRRVAAVTRLAQRLDDARRTLAGAEITLTPLSPEQAHAVLATCADPTRDPTHGWTHSWEHTP
ncbi:MAG: PrgI family protein [Acidimicrobiales bacterium]|nr:PrgI family protein [Acidimicrobiales bacterium]